MRVGRFGQFVGTGSDQGDPLTTASTLLLSYPKVFCPSEKTAWRLMGFHRLVLSTIASYSSQEKNTTRGMILCAHPQRLVETL